MTASLIDFEKAKANLAAKQSITTEDRGYEALDLGIPLTDRNQRRKVNDIFHWMSETIKKQNLNIYDLKNADPRRADLERLLDACFGEKQDSITEESREVIRDAYYNAWRSIWEEREKYPNVKPLLKLARAQDAPVIRYITKEELNGLSPEAFLKAEHGRIWEVDGSFNGLKRRCNLKEDGVLIVTDCSCGDFFPIYTLKSLSALVATKTAWTEDKIVQALRRSCLTSPILIRLNQQNTMLFDKRKHQ